jgi:hypothetical protein
MAVVVRSATTLDHITPVVIPAAASWGTAANVPDGDTFPNGGNTLLIMNNTGASTYTVTIAVESTVDGLAVASRVHSLTAGQIKIVKLGPSRIYGTTTKVTAENVAVRLIAYAV